MKKSFAAMFFPLPETIPPPDSKKRSQTHLHEQLKWLYSEGGVYATEVKIGRWYADVQRGPLFVEIQTTAFSALKSKLAQLLPEHPVRLVTTIPVEKILVQFDRSGRREVSRRRSPRRPKLVEVFNELVFLSGLAAHPNFSLEVLLTQEEEHRRNDGRGAWRRSNRQSIQDRVLIEIKQRELFQTPRDYLRLLPDKLPEIFHSRQLAKELAIPAYLAQRITYFLRIHGLLQVLSRNRNGIQYRLASGKIRHRT
jgi:hypothetical protein